MGKSKKEKRQAYFFDNKALLALILPLVVEQLLAVLVGMADSTLKSSRRKIIFHTLSQMAIAVCT